MTSQSSIENPQRCPAFRKDGDPCTALARADGYCVGHSPQAQEARRKGGYGCSRSARASRLLPARLRPVVTLLENALREVYEGELDPRIVTAMASISGALVRVFTAGELEERLRVLENLKKQGTDQ